MFLSFAIVQADWPIHPKDRDPKLNLYLGDEPPIAPNKWRYGETMVTFSDSGRMLTVSGKGAMVNYDIATMGSIPPPWYDSRDSIISVVVEEGVKYIGDGAFYNCKNLMTVTISNSVTSIGYAAFSDCKSLKSITIPDSVTTIKKWTFSNCESLTSVIIHNSVTTIGPAVFSGCKSLKSITIPNSVTTIEGAAFLYCYNLTSIMIPKSMKTIEEYMFRGCYNLKSVTIPNGVTSIGSAAFFECTGLTSVTIPGSVRIIEGYAFLNCTSLTSIIVQSRTPSKIYFSSFDSTTKVNACLYVPASSVANYRAAEYWEDFECIRAPNKSVIALSIILSAMILSAAGFVIIKKSRKSSGLIGKT